MKKIIRKAIKKIMRKILVFIVILLLTFSGISFAKYRETTRGKVVACLKNPIFIVKNSKEVEGKISSTNNYYETEFSVLNYLEDTKESTEIGFDYTIKIIPSTKNFPVKYRLVRLDTNEEAELDSNLETSPQTLDTNPQSNLYKLIAYWDFENSKQNFEENLNVKVLVRGVQINND